MNDENKGINNNNFGNLMNMNMNINMMNNIKNFCC
jgi:hypothetical protein